MFSRVKKRARTVAGPVIELPLAVRQGGKGMLAVKLRRHHDPLLYSSFSINQILCDTRSTFTRNHHIAKSAPTIETPGAV